MSPKRLLIVTDVPFWRASTGAEQRISSLTRTLNLELSNVKVLFLDGEHLNASKSEADLLAIANLGLNVEFRRSDQPPKSTWSRLRWRFEGIVNFMAGFFKETNRNSGDATQQLSDFHWPWASIGFRETVDEFQPDVVLIEYIKWAHLLDSLPTVQRNEITAVVDTHDLLHRRKNEFERHGHEHWLNVTRTEEAEALGRFDVVMAIQETEAAEMQRMAPDSKVIVCGHACYPDGVAPQSARTATVDIDHSAAQPLRLGILASKNAANRLAIQEFLDGFWNTNFANSDSVTLTIAGSVCESITQPSLPSVNLLGKVEEVADFYQTIDAAINPTQFGSGLKIKNVEALAHGKPLITTAHAAVGLPADSTAILVADNSMGLLNAIELLSDADFLRQSSDAALSIASKSFSARSAYAELLKHISAI